MGRATMRHSITAALGLSYLALGTPALAETGDAKVTRGHGLKARHVIHTVGPVWHGGGRGEPALLAACYRESLTLAYAHGLRSIAFPAISTGAYGYPADLAAAVAVGTVREFVAVNDGLERVSFCCFSTADLAIYQKVLAKRPDA